MLLKSSLKEVEIMLKWDNGGYRNAHWPRNTSVYLLLLKLGVLFILYYIQLTLGDINYKNRTWKAMPVPQDTGWLPLTISRATGHILGFTLAVPRTKQLMWAVKGTSTGSEPVSPTQHETSACGLWTPKFWGKDRENLFSEALLHAVYRVWQQ